MGYAHVYAHAIMHRGRVPMEPVDFVPDWADRPRKAKFHPYAETLPLPAETPAEMPDAVAQRPAAGFTLPLLSGLLRDSYGLTGRRLAVQANTDLAALPHYTHANWSRGTASGGGLYPVGIHWAAGPGGPLTPGLYHYAPHQHGLRRLLTGDVTGQVREALGAGAGAAAQATQYLVLSVKYWQNAFKYNSFSFHAVSMDVGALVQTWRLWAAQYGLRIDPVLWFDEERLARLLGVVPEEEGVFAVVPLTWKDGTAPGESTTAPGDSTAVPGESLPVPGTAGAADAAVRHRDVERSRQVIVFETLLRIHDATAGRAADRPAQGLLDRAAALPPRGADPLPLPPPRAAGRHRAGPARTPQQLRPLRRLPAGRVRPVRRRTGRLRGHPVRHGGRTPGRPPLTSLYAFVNHVEGIAPGAYAYDPAAHTLRLVKPGPPGPFLQRNYFLSNYNLEQAGAVLVPTVRTTAVLDTVGDRGYRLVGGTIGAVAQTFYTTAAALGLGAGVALGFDNIAYIEELGLTGTDEAPLLIMLLGHERPRPADFRHEIA